MGQAGATANPLSPPDEGLTFATPADWSAWLALNHATAPDVWVTYWKKGTGKSSITWQEAVVEALCWGWIDGIRRSLDAERFTQRFTPRRPGSAWSRINRDHALRLITEGRMQPSGLRAVEAAKASGQWDKAYSARAEVPEDFRAALALASAAQTAWQALDNRNRFAIIYRLERLRRPETRARRIDDFIAMLARGDRIY